MQSSPLQARALTEADAKAAAIIHAASFDTAWTADTLAGHIARDLCVGLCSGETLLGFAVLSVAADQSDIITIAIDRDQRGKGLGLQLLGAVHGAAKAKGVAVIFLEVAVDNAAANALYKSAGYAPIGRRPAYYKRAHGRVAAATYRKDL